jgi:hypothetical protein
MPSAVHCTKSNLSALSHLSCMSLIYIIREFIIIMIKYEVVTVHTMMAYWGSGSIYPLIFDLSPRSPQLCV